MPFTGSDSQVRLSQNSTNFHRNQELKLSFTLRLFFGKSMSESWETRLSWRKLVISITTWKCVGAIHNINNYLTKFPHNYDVGEKLSDAALLDPLSTWFLKRSRTLLTEHDQTPEIGTINHFIELCKCAGVAESIKFERRAWQIIEVDNFGSFSDVSNCRSKKKDRKKSKRATNRKSSRKSDFYCDLHVQNDSHDTVNCNFLKAEPNGTSWKNPKHEECSNKTRFVL